MKPPRRKDIRIVITHPAIVRAGTNLLLVALFIAAFFTVEPSDTDWGLETIQSAKYAPIIAASASAACYLVGLKGVPLGWPVLFLAALSTACVSAGFFTLMGHNVQLYQTYVGRGLCVITFAPAYMLCLVPKEKKHFGKYAARIMMMAVTVMIPILVAWRLGFRMVNRAHIYHEEVLYFGAAAGFALAVYRPVVRRLGGLALILACILTIKLTGFGLAMIVTMVAWLVETAGRPDESKRPLLNRRLWVSQAVFGGAAIAVSLARVFRRSLPGGSRQVRLETYGVRISEFVASPIWGSLFVGSPVMQIGLTVIPSHSDLLDLLASGGVIGAALFYLPAVAGVIHGIRSVKRFVRDCDGVALFGLAGVSCFLFESAFNPVLGQPKLVVLYWMALGVLLADRAIIGSTNRSLPVRHTRVGSLLTGSGGTGVRRMRDNPSPISLQG